MESFEGDNLAATLRTLRPAPRAEFAAELDRRAAAGFPRRSAEGESPLGRLLARLRAMPPRRALLPAAAATLTAIAVATAIVATNRSGTSAPAPAVAAVPGGGQAGPDSGDAARHPQGRRDAGGQVHRPARLTPNHLDGYRPPHSRQNFDARGPYLKASASNLSNVTIVPSSEEVGSAAQASLPYAAQRSSRDVQRAAQIVLGTDPSQVDRAAAQVLSAVHRYDGIVLSSSVHGGSEGGAGARFEMVVPSARLSEALAAFSSIADVRYRHQGTEDITAPTIGATELLQDSHARVQGLLKQLAGSETEAAREAVEAQLRSERRRSAALGSQLRSLRRHAALAHVRLLIKSDESGETSGGSWGVGDALGDAGHILAVAAGVAIVGLAILAPLALLALLVWLATRAWLRRSRERTLG